VDGRLAAHWFATRCHSGQHDQKRFSTAGRACDRRTRSLASAGCQGQTGHTFSQPDLIIAATAFHHGLTVVTRDSGDYQLARVARLNAWLDGSA
jgi:predicted nucleic acid-binding protein